MMNLHQYPSVNVMGANLIMLPWDKVQLLLDNGEILESVRQPFVADFCCMRGPRIVMFRFGSNMKIKDVAKLNIELLKDKRMEVELKTKHRKLYHYSVPRLAKMLNTSMVTLIHEITDAMIRYNEGETKELEDLFELFYKALRANGSVNELDA